MKMTTKDIFNILRTAMMVLCLSLFLSSFYNGEVKEAGDSNINENNQQYEKQPNNCWQKSMMETLYKATGIGAMKALKGLTNGAMSVVMLGFAVWFAMRMLTFVTRFTEQTSGELWNEVGKQFFACMVCGMIASQAGLCIWALNTLVFPIFYTFIELGSRVLGTIGIEAKKTQEIFGETGSGMGKTAIAYATPICTNSDTTGFTEGAFPPGPNEVMGCMLCAMSSRLAVGMKLASMLINLDAGFIFGIFLWVVFLIVRISFVFYVVDATFRMGMMVVICPLLVMAYPFKVTRSWAMKGFNITINVSALMMFMGIVLAATMLALQYVIDEYDGLSFSTGVDTDDKEVDTAIGAFPLCIVILLIAFLALSSMSVAKSLTDKLVGGGVNANFAKQGAAALAWLGKKVVAPLLKAGAKRVFGDRYKKHLARMNQLAGRETEAED